MLQTIENMPDAKCKPSGTKMPPCDVCGGPAEFIVNRVPYCREHWQVRLLLPVED